MSNDLLPLKKSEQLILHLMSFSGSRDEYKVPFPVSQSGIANALGGTRSHVSYYVKKMTADGTLVERLGRIAGLPRKRKAYFLTPKGVEKGKRILSRLIKDGIEIEKDDKRFAIEIAGSAFEFHTGSYLDLIIGKVEERIALESEDERLDYILMEERKPVEDAYMPLLREEVLSGIEKAVDEGGSALLLAGDSWGLVDTYLSTLALYFSKVCNVFVWDYNRFSTPEEVIRELSVFLGKLGDFSAQSMIDEGRGYRVVREYIAKTFEGLAVIMIGRGEPLRKVSSDMREILVELEGFDIPLIFADDSPGTALPEDAVSIEIERIDEVVLDEIRRRLSSEAEAVEWTGRMKKVLYSESSLSPRLLEYAVRHGGPEIVAELSGTNEGFYISRLKDLADEEMLDAVAGMAGTDQPVFKGQVPDPFASKFASLVETGLLDEDPNDFRLPYETRDAVKNVFSAERIRQRALSLFGEMSFLTHAQMIERIILMKDTSETFRGISQACDLMTLWLERPGSFAAPPDLSEMFSEMVENNLSRKAVAAYHTLEGFLKLYRGEVKGAERLSETATTTGEHLKNVEILSRSHYLQGKIYLGRGEFENGLEKMVISHNLSKEEESPVSSLAAMAISDIFKHFGEVNKALSYIDIAVELADRTQLASLRSLIYARQGRLYEEKGLYSKAATSFTEAADIASRYGDVREALEYELTKADVLVERGYGKEALTIYQGVAGRAEEKGLGVIQLKAYAALSRECSSEGTVSKLLWDEKVKRIRTLMGKAEESESGGEGCGGEE